MVLVYVKIYSAARGRARRNLKKRTPPSAHVDTGDAAANGSSNLLPVDGNCPDEGGAPMLGGSVRRKLFSDLPSNATIPEEDISRLSPSDEEEHSSDLAAFDAHGPYADSDASSPTEPSPFAVDAAASITPRFSAISADDVDDIDDDDKFDPLGAVVRNNHHHHNHRQRHVTASSADFTADDVTDSSCGGGSGSGDTPVRLLIPKRKAAAAAAAARRQHHHHHSGATLEPELVEGVPRATAVARILLRQRQHQQNDATSTSSSTTDLFGQRRYLRAESLPDGQLDVTSQRLLATSGVGGADGIAACTAGAGAACVAHPHRLFGWRGGSQRITSTRTSSAFATPRIEISGELLQEMQASSMSTPVAAGARRPSLMQELFQSPSFLSLTTLKTKYADRRQRIAAERARRIDEAERQRRKIARAKERRATVVLGIVMASFIGCWLPFFSIYPAASLAGLRVPDVAFAVIFWLGYVNSALNPIIYTIFNRDFRHAFERLLFGRRRGSASGGGGGGGARRGQHSKQKC